MPHLVGLSLAQPMLARCLALSGEPLHGLHDGRLPCGDGLLEDPFRFVHNAENSILATRRPLHELTRLHNRIGYNLRMYKRATGSRRGMAQSAVRLCLQSLRCKAVPHVPARMSSACEYPPGLELFESAGPHQEHVESWNQDPPSDTSEDLLEHSDVTSLGGTTIETTHSGNTKLHIAKLVDIASAAQAIDPCFFHTPDSDLGESVLDGIVQAACSVGLPSSEVASCEPAPHEKEIKGETIAIGDDGDDRTAVVQGEIARGCGATSASSRATTRDIISDEEIAKVMRQLGCSRGEALEAYKPMNIAIVTEELLCNEAWAEELLCRHSWDPFVVRAVETDYNVVMGDHRLHEDRMPTELRTSWGTVIPLPGDDEQCVFFKFAGRAVQADPDYPDFEWAEPIEPLPRTTDLCPVECLGDASTTAVSDSELSDASSSSRSTASVTGTTWSPGTRVRTHGLQGSIDLNGTVGRIIGYISMSTRYEVKISGCRGSKAIKTANLQLF